MKIKLNYVQYEIWDLRSRSGLQEISGLAEEEPVL